MTLKLPVSYVLLSSIQALIPPGTLSKLQDNHE